MSLVAEAEGLQEGNRRKDRVVPLVMSRQLQALEQSRRDRRLSRLHAGADHSLRLPVTTTQPSSILPKW